MNSKTFGFLLAVAALAGCGKKANPDMAFCSPDDAFVAHVRVADAMASKAGKELISTLNVVQNFLTGSASLEKELGIGLDGIESLTLAVPDGDSPKPRIVLHTKGDFKIDALFPGQAREKVDVAGFKEAFAVGPHLALQLDSKRIVILPRQAADAATLKFDFPKEGPLTPAFEAIARGKSHLVIGVNPKTVDAAGLNGPASALAEFVKAGRVPVIEATIGDDVGLNLTVFSPDADDAEKVAKAMADLLAQLSGQIKVAGKSAANTPGAPLMDAAAKSLEGAKITGSGKSRTLSAAMAFDSKVLAGLMLPSTEKVREAADRTRAQNNLKQVVLGMHNYEGAFQKFPPTEVKTPGKAGPGLSWRVAILPWIEEETLYRQFKHDEPWDSDHNKKLLTKMPKVFMIPGSDPAAAAAGKTYLRTFSLGKGMKVLDIADGLSNTIAVVEAADAVEWTKPDELDADAKDPHALIRWGWNGGTVANLALFDGSVRSVQKKISAKTLKAAVTPNGGEVFGDDW